MDEQLRQRLTDMTREFYRHHAKSFAETRQHGWASWHRLLAALPDQPASVIDYGCGNGRFLEFLKGRGFNGRYLGVDSDRSLLQIASNAHPSQTFRFTQDPTETQDQAALVSCFGVMHHIPGRVERGKFLQKLASLVAPGGTLAISFWQPERLGNFASKTLAPHGISGLEVGDYLFGWNGDFSHLRYCHHFTEVEIDELVQLPNFSLLERFEGTNNDATNTYALMTRL